MACFELMACSEAPRREAVADKRQAQESDCRIIFCSELAAENVRKNQKPPTSK
jgi:hypothetical protein